MSPASFAPSSVVFESQARMPKASLFAEIEFKLDKGINMAEETYKALVKANGIKSLEEAEKLKRKRMTSETQCKNLT